MFKSRIISTILTIFALVSLPAGVYLVLHETHFLNKAFGTPANIYVDAQTAIAGPQGVWKNLAQGGEEKGRMLSPVIPKIAELKPQYIRIDHIYDLYNVVSKDSSGNLVYNWTELDQTVQDILSTGALPFFSLSYMPPVISSDGDITGTPANWADWELTVERTIEHYSGRSGMNLNSVYYEVWNEPDLFGKFKIGGGKNYLDLYIHSAAGASRASNVNSFKFGGPASTDLYKNWFDSMMRMADSGVRMDFFSWHKYSDDIGTFESQVADIKSWLAAYPGQANTELIVSEIGINSKNDSRYDGNLSAIHLIATSAILEGNVGKTFVFEIKDGLGDKQYWGRWGLLTNDKFGPPVQKPRFNAGLFLNRMNGTKLLTVGQGSWVKAFSVQEGNVLRVLVVNYDPWGNHAESVPIRIDRIENRNYTLRRINFGGSTRTRPVQVAAGVLDLTELFDANTAAIFEITPQ